MKKIVLAAMLGLIVAGGPAGAFSLPELLQRNGQASQAPRASEAPVVLAQTSDPARIQQLEEEIRQLNGRIEEMSFQLLQMQEQMRKTQEDNEFRFQELEKSDNGAAGSPAATASTEQPAAPEAPADDVARVIDTPPPAAPSTGSGAGAPETVLGSIDFDQNGNPRDVTRNENANNSSGLPGVDTGSGVPSPGQSTDAQQTASLGNENDTYQVSYNHVLSGDYALAEQGFTQYLTEFPEGERAADASFWLGEAQYSQGKYNEAAKTFLNAHQTYNKSAKAPEMLLKLGMSLAALDNTETACATLKEVPKRYPEAPRPVLAKTSSEQKRLGC
ncbi:tol-pal system protein YbgF [Pseudorhizobium tarimense]|uniref:Cell division coordinator CpoB n=1 Tax=Pseudorhizobium tarimense TaxID=1079109 RepID=A0ABV2H7N6_9HYPH|nr:tol-pal system protein YbgF [Pseudorhizobium tarimense]MCJ8519607.1 tol-pal system protein YbgF [Pseudorhizobium tarimense]